MPERSVAVSAAVGLHARPAAIFCQAAAATGVAITVTAPNGRSALAASILGVLSLGVDHGQVVSLSAEGEGADAALDSLAALLTTGLDA
ncbi:MAG: HPr family phosphocarrier protein [Microbacteriaceae bacterium]|nr:HPr family phosphocarrier protein [Microbacteriaceae bacterium]